MTIKINDFITCNKGITPEEGEVIYKMIVGSPEVVELDFLGVEMLTTAFLNVMIGNLYKDYSSEQLKEKLKFLHLTEGIASRIKKVTTNAKLFYKDEAKYNSTIEQVLDGNN